MVRSLAIPISLLLALLIPLVTVVGDEKDQSEKKAINTVGMIRVAAENTLGLPTAVELWEDSRWLALSPVEQENAVYKISLEGKGRDLLSFAGKMVKIWGSVAMNEEGETLFHVANYEPLMELFGSVRKAHRSDVTQKIPSLEFIENPQAVFKYRSPWTLEVEGDLQEKLLECIDQDIRARGIVRHEGRKHLFQVLRFDKIESLVCTLDTVKQDDEGSNFIEAKISEKDGDREFFLHLDAKAKELLYATKVGADIDIRGVIEDRNGTQYMQIVTYQTENSETPEEDTEENDEENESPEEDEEWLEPPHEDEPH